MTSGSNQKRTGRRTIGGRRANDAALYEVLKSLPVAVYHIDLVQPRFLMVNELMCRESGYSEDELLSMNPMNILSPKSRAVDFTPILRSSSRSTMAYSVS